MEEEQEVRVEECGRREKEEVKVERSEERRGGKEGLRLWRSWWSPYH